MIFECRSRNVLAPGQYNPCMGNLAHDLRFAARTFKKSPVFVAVAILSLALGIGANTAIFTLVDQLLLRLLPVKDPQQLVLLWGRGKHYGSNNGRYKLSYPMYEDFRDHNQVFSGMFCRWATSFSISSEGRTERVDGDLVSGTYFPVLGVGPALGRVFTPDDDRVPGGHPVAVISYRYWQSRFGGSKDVIGKKLLVDGYPLVLIEMLIVRCKQDKPHWGAPKLRERQARLYPDVCTSATRCLLRRPRPAPDAHASLLKLPPPQIIFCAAAPAPGLRPLVRVIAPYRRVKNRSHVCRTPQVRQ